MWVEKANCLFKEAKEEIMPNITLKDLVNILYNKISNYIQEKDIAPAEAKDLADAIYTLTKILEE